MVAQKVGAMKNKRDNLEWRPIKGFENQYEVSNYGDFHVLPYQFVDKANGVIHRKEKYFWSEELFPYGGTKNNYLGIHLGGMKKSYAHIIVAQSFIPNPDNKTQVNHKDGNTHNNYCGCKKNNYLDSNLEWVTPKENMEHASVNGLINTESEKRKEQCRINRSKVNYKNILHPVIQLDLNGNLIKEYNSIKDAEIETGIKSQNIRAVASKDGYHKTAGGFNWIYKENYNPNNDYSVIINQFESAKKKVGKYDLQNNLIEKYNSIKDACLKNGYPIKNYIGEVCSGKRKTYKGFIWKFI